MPGSKTSGRVGWSCARMSWPSPSGGLGWCGNPHPPGRAGIRLPPPQQHLTARKSRKLQALSEGGNLLRQEVIMSEPLSPELEAKAQELAARIQTRSADAILEMARKLVATTDDTLFGDTEFTLRDQARGIVADAYHEHLPQKRDTPPAPSTAPTADAEPPSTGTARKRSRRSAGRSRATGPTTTADSAAKAPAPGTGVSD